MQITEITLTNFRKFSNFKINFNKITVIIGENGSGKTSILESIYTLSRGHSFNTRQITPLVKIQETKFILFAKINSDNKSHNIGLAKSLNNDTIRKLDQKKLSSHNEIINKIPVLAITPLRFTLLKQPASARRNLLDWGVYYKYPEFVNYWRDAKRILKQRNILLKKRSPKNQIVIWDKNLIILSEKINDLRSQYFTEFMEILSPKIKKAFPEIPIKITYYKGWSADISFAQSLDKSFESDIKVGYTRPGAHRADLKISVHSQNATQILSQGQQKTLASLIFLTQATLFNKHQKNPCAILLDDLNSELDQNNLKELLDQFIKQDHQIILTAISEDLPIIKLLEDHKICEKYKDKFTKFNLESNHCAI